MAFFNRGKNQQTGNGPRVAESAIGGFSEFADISGGTTPNLLTFVGATTVEEARPPRKEKQQDSDALYAVAKVNGDPRVPRFSRRQRFVDDVVEGHPLVARAMVNRLWAVMMGRGLVHPHNEMDSAHPASHPGLLDFLVADFQQHGQSMRRTLRRIALSEAYQRSAKRPDSVEDPSAFAYYLERPLTAEQWARSTQLVLRGEYRNDDAIVALAREQFPDVLPHSTAVSIADALFLSNNEQFAAYLRASRDKQHLLGRIANVENNTSRIQLMFETILSRPADEQELVVLRAYADKRGSNSSAWTNVAWSLLTSAEFRFNH